MSKVIIAALASAVKSVKELPPTPTFDRAKSEQTLKDCTGLDGKDLAAMVDFAAKKHSDKYGDTETLAIQAVFNALASGIEGGFETLSPIMSRLATAARSAGKLSVTGSQWVSAIHGKDDAEKDVVALVAKVKTLRQGAKAWSEVQSALNLTDASRQQLYMIVKDLAKDKAKDFSPAA
jgi:hypothetical protein